MRVLDGMLRRVGIIRLWPETLAAEHESIERFRFALSMLGVELVELDRSGKFFDQPGRRVTQNDVDFVISLHFETPKSYDCFSWGALWNPNDFYVDWGFDRFVDHQFSHDGYFHCDSPMTRRLARTELGERYAQVAHANVNHTLSGPVYPASHRSDRRLAYCGINWEALGREGGRFGPLLSPLDKAGVLDIYGPAQLQGVKVWDGFAGYKGEVPFDGITLVGEIARSGAVLALSSNAHLRAGIMTSRLFEGASAGALVFADGNSFVERHFADETVPIALSGDAIRDARRIEEALDHFNAHPDEGLAKAQALQTKFLSRYMLHDQLLGVYEGYAKVRSCTESPINATPPTEIGYIIPWSGLPADFPCETLESIQRQAFGRARVRLLCLAETPMQSRPVGDAYKSMDIEIIRCGGGPGSSPTMGNMLVEAIDSFPDSVRHIAILSSGAALFARYADKMVAGANSNPYGSMCGLVTCAVVETTAKASSAETVDYWRPRSGQDAIPKCLDNVLLRRDFLDSIAGGVQMLGFAGLRALLHGYSREMHVCDEPLVRVDLDERGKLDGLDDTPYPEPAQFLRRYWPATASAGYDAESALKKMEDDHLQIATPSLAARMIARAAPVGGVIVRVMWRMLLARARRAARARDWAGAEHHYARLLQLDGRDAKLWRQFGHALREQDHLVAARAAYEVSLDLLPEDAETKWHVRNVDTIARDQARRRARSAN
ncbi:MAG: glycosyltransferase family 1 protein [Sphingomonadales bacterium]|nr:glycosyltransferase family 1 protein [Sphingomonadales bacterium]